MRINMTKNKALKTVSELMSELNFSQLRHKSKLSGKHYTVDIDDQLLTFPAKVVGGILIVDIGDKQWKAIGEIIF